MNFHAHHPQPTEAMLAAAALVQDWSIGVLIAVQDLHIERCSGGQQGCPFDRYDYPSAIEAAGVWLRQLIEAYGDQWIDAPVVAARLQPHVVAELIFLDSDQWALLADQAHSRRALGSERMRTEVARENARARER